MGKPFQCMACSLSLKGQGFVPPSGLASNGVLLVGEAPGYREAQLSEPFVGDAGMQLNRTLAYTKSERREFGIDNVCKCRPPANWLEGAPWEYDAVTHCTPYLVDTVRRLKPKVVVPMGNVALRSILGLRGIQKFRGYVYEGMMGGEFFKVVPTYHPSFLLRGKQNLTPVQAADIRRSVKVAKLGYDPPTLDFLGDFVSGLAAVDKSEGVLAFDIETPSTGGIEEDEYGEITDAEIIRVSFSWKPGFAVTIPWRQYNIPLINQLLKGWKWVVFWNADFDVPRLKAEGVEFEDNILDAMWLWHWNQSDLPRGLGYAASLLTEWQEWKSLSDTEPEKYSAMDAAATIECYREMEATAVKQGRFDQFIRHYVKLQPRVNVMARRGVLIDPVAKEAFRNEINKELEAVDGDIQAVVPREVRTFKRRAKVPREAMLGEAVRPGRGDWLWDFNDDGEWGERQQFLYGSPKQIVRYIKYRDHPVPRDRRTDKDTTNADAIEALAKKYPDDPLYPLILNAREFRKVMGTYIEGYEPGPDGRVRTTFGRKPSTWRFSSDNPNVQNVIKRGNLAKAYRRQFIAAPGHVLVEFDYKAIEAVITGYLANDPEYVRAAQLGVHSILMSHIVGRPINLALPDPVIRKLTDELKVENGVLYDGCKRCVHLSNYGGTPRRMRLAYPDLFPTVAAAKSIQDIFFATIAKKVRAWQEDTKREAHQKHFLDNPFGYRHWFWDVYHGYGAQQEWGTDAKRSMAFRPQSTAAGVMSEAILTVSETEVWQYVLWMIHDALLTEMPDDSNLTGRILLVKTCMEQPLKELPGLRFEVEVSIGTNWGEMNLWRLN